MILMKKYKSTYHDPITFEGSEIETEIPESIVQKIQESLRLLESEYYITPPMISQDKSNVIFGLIESNINSKRLKYKIEISLHNENN